jgi:glutamyl-tRNA synthetase
MNRHTTDDARYRGRLAPSPTGYLHLGHARTFWAAQQQARAAGGTLILRIENLDHSRCKPEFVKAIYEDLRWFGFHWDEGPDCDGPFAPYEQGERMSFYRETLRALTERDAIYPCGCSRKDIQSAVAAPHASDDEAIYPGTCRTGRPPYSDSPPSTRVSWRFRVPDGERISFGDANLGPQHFVAGKDFGDFVVWRHDNVPSYQLACVVDDAAMRITEVVRGADLLLSTARQILLYRALGLPSPTFFHCPLMTDSSGVRLAKRHAALSLRQLRLQGSDPERLRMAWE